MFRYKIVSEKLNPPDTWFTIFTFLLCPYVLYFDSLQKRRTIMRGATPMPRQTGIKEIAKNRKAFHEYFVLERFEAGVELFGTEVKSIRAGQVNLKDSFCTIKDGELFARGLHISPYEHGNIFNKDPMRPKKLLMHKREILKLQARVMQDGVALIPLSLYFKDSRVKLELGLCKGKKLHDKRDSAAQRESKRDIERALKERNTA